MAGSPLAGEVAIVTGASSGIGRATARELVAAGARVALVARRRDVLEALAAELSETGPGEAVSLPADVTDESAVERVVRTAADTFGALDALVSAAGAGAVTPVGELSGAELDRVWAVNARGAILAARHVAPRLAAQGRGTIVQVGSVSALRGWAGGTAYVSSKFALRGATECLRAELGPFGVRVVHVCPDLTDTGLFAAAGIALSGRAAMLAAEDVARTIRFALELPDHAELTEVVLRAVRRA
jgi:NADP-dependent 3-hydroxy acid dehydrogenase YdfG